MSSGDRNVIKKEVINIRKYKDVRVVIHRSWNVLIKVIPVATKPISKSIRQYLSNIRGKLEMKELQKTAIQGTAHTLREVLM
jgi:hypothetical protein